MTQPKPVVPSGQEAILTELLSVDPTVSGGWVLRGFRAEAHVVSARYADPEGREVVLRLGHPAHTPDPEATTERFAMAFAGPSRPHELLAAVRRRVADSESRFTWRVPEPQSARPRQQTVPRPGFTELERIALLAGVKPALRVHEGLVPLERMAAEFERQGFHTAEYRSRVPPRRLLFVAQESAVATRLGELERAIARDVVFRSRRCVDAVRDAGLLLGYPSCCAASFASRYERSPHPLLPRRQSLAYVAACEAWVPKPRYLLNDAMAAIGSSYISFEPCRYDCSEALRVAERVANAIGTHDPALRERIDTELRRDVLVLASGQRAVLQLRDDAIEALDPLPAPKRVVTKSVDLDELRAARVDARGRLSGRDDALVIRFGRPA